MIEDALILKEGPPEQAEEITRRPFKVKNEHGEILLCHRRDQDLWNLPGVC